MGYLVAQVFVNRTGFSITPKSITAVTHPLVKFFRGKKQTINTEKVVEIKVMMRTGEGGGDKYVKFNLDDNNEIELYPDFESKSEIAEFLALVLRGLLVRRNSCAKLE